MKRKVLSLVMISLLILSSFSFAFAADAATTITIFHTNDTHARLLSNDTNIGFAKIATLIKEARLSDPNTLLLDAGDTLHGMPIVNISKGQNAVKVLEATGYDYMTLGNHDFNYGQERLLELKNMSSVGMLSANVLDKDGKSLFTPYVIKEINGVKVGIFGLSTPETAYKTSPANVEGLTFANPVETAQKIVNEIKDQTDVIIGIVHLGLDGGSEFTSERLAKEVEGIDVLIDGHSHTLLENGQVVNNTLIAQTFEHDKNLGKVTIEVTDGKVVNKTAELINVSKVAEVIPDPEVTKIIDEINAENAEVFAQVVAKTDVYLDGVRANVRTRETNLGNLSADAVRKAAGSDIGFVNGGNIRVDIQPGDITFGKLAELFPFGNTVQVKKITGADLVKVLEISVQAYPEAQGGFLQVSGMSFEFDPSQPAGSRVVGVKIGESELDLSAEYTVAINDFLGIGGDGYELFKNYPIYGEVGTYEEVFADYLNTNGTKGSDVSGRITVKATAPAAEPTPAPAPVEPAPVVEPAPAPAPAQTEVSYIVVSGDVLWKIAEKYNTTWEALAKYNNLSNPNLIFPNQVIKVPAK
ncbi:5'-nucleotidase C-terminal domain-containing protein [Sedimentibacter sp. B4]|uniref:5'-nucleotidase C-terminal domain-containing protein n=1 Tax=Sedimentibacter sp. B4 TaxID=304766 RepID=UPI0002DE9950|nr:5'-nucleotidase C-terminal domain-containing protein [Sedimentibacter sp. B4]